jgi:predicted transposase YbfD/YdcC
MDYTFISIIKKIEDPRIDRLKLYPLDEIILVAIATILCGGEGYADMHTFGNSQVDFFKTILPFKNGIPSEDTYERVFKLINAKAFQECLNEWIMTLQNLKKDGTGDDRRMIGIDGKTLKGSRSKLAKPLHMVSAWASDNRCVLGSRAVDAKSNEITAIPEVLKMLSLENAIITMDAMGCQKSIVNQVVEQKGDLVIALKGNQGNLHDDVKSFFEIEEKNDFKDVVVQKIVTTEKDHGRFEKREYALCCNVEWLKQRNPGWDKINSIGFVNSSRTIGEITTHERRYYISSLRGDVKLFAKATRSHWGIENSLHWVLDVIFREDDCRIRDKNAAENFALMRRTAIFLLAADPSKLSKRSRRLKAGWDNRYLKKLLLQDF